MELAALQNKKIPTFIALFGVLLLIGALFTATRGIDQIRKLFVAADTDIEPSGQVSTANISDSSFTVLWTSAKDATGAVFYGTTPELKDGVAVDQRDLSSPNGKYKTHFVRLSGLSSNTKYYFKLGISTPTFGDPNKGAAPFEITTAPQTASQPPSANPLSGKVLKQSGQPATGAIITFNSQGLTPQAALASSDGTFEIPLASARSEDLQNFFQIPSGQQEIVTLDAGTGATASITCAYQTNDHPFPDIKLGETINCQSGQATASPAPLLPVTSTPETGGSSSGTPAHFTIPNSISPGTGGNLQVNLSQGQTVSTSLPTISGKAGPKQAVKIVIHSDQTYSATVIASANGSWSWTPPTNLSPGEHTVTITIINQDGSTQVITRTFYVSAGSSILPITSGTPSGQLTTPTLTPMLTPAPVTPPETGALENTFIIAALAIGLITFSALLTFVKS